MTLEREDDRFVLSKSSAGPRRTVAVSGVPSRASAAVARRVRPERPHAVVASAVSAGVPLGRLAATPRRTTSRAEVAR